MSIELLGLCIIVGLVIFFIAISFNQEKDDIDSDISIRLDNIKNKVFDNVNKKEADERKTPNKNIKFLIQDTEYKIEFLGNILQKLTFTAKIKQMLKVANLRVEIDVFLLFSAGLSVPFLVLAFLISGKSIVLVIFGLIAGISPFILVNMRIKKRLQQFTQQFPDGLGLISSSLKAGHALPSAFKMVVEEMPEPISQMFKIVADDITLGRDMREALESMSSFMPESIDLRFFITAILIQREIGGNLPEIFDKLSYTIRERFKLIGQLNAQTAQATLSGYILGCAPLLIGGVIWVVNPKYMEPYTNDLMAQVALVVAAICEVIGFFIIKQITNIRV